MGLRFTEQREADGSVEIREQVTGRIRLTIVDEFAGMLSGNVTPGSIVRLKRALDEYCAPRVVDLGCEAAAAEDTLTVAKLPGDCQHS